MSQPDTFEVEVRPLCSLCGRPEAQHNMENFNIRHRFAPPGQAVTLTENDRATESPPDSIPASHGNVRNASGGSSDALLRMILIRKGILTVQELNEIEAELQASGAIVYEPVGKS